jgi:hypothetical protein
MECQSRQENEGQNRNLKRANTSFENTVQFRYLGTTATYQNLIPGEIKGTLISANACYYSVKKLFLSSAVQNVNIKTCKTIILPVVLYGCETLSLTLKEEHILRVFENSMLRGIFGPGGMK